MSPKRLGVTRFSLLAPPGAGNTDMTTRTAAIVLAVLLAFGVVGAIAPAASALPVHCTVGPGVDCSVDFCPTPIVCIREDLPP